MTTKKMSAEQKARYAKELDDSLKKHARHAGDFGKCQKPYCVKSRAWLAALRRAVH